MKKVNQLKAGAVLSYVSLIVHNLVGIMYTPIMIRLLGKSEYGLYNLANSVVGYLAVLDLGLGNTIIRYTSKYRAEKDEEGESKLIGLCLSIYLLLSLIVILVGSILVINVEKIFSNSLTPSEVGTMKKLVIFMVFNVAITLTGSVFSSIIIAYEKFVFPKILTIFRSILNPFVMLPLLLMGYKSIAITAATTVINIMFIIINMYYCFKKLNIKIKFKKMDFSILKEIGIYSILVFLVMIVDKIYWSTDQFILGIVCGTSSVAVYAISSTIINYYLNFSTALSGVFLPKVTKMVTNNAKEKEISDLFIKIGRIQFILMAFILGGFLIAGTDFIMFLGGKQYTGKINYIYATTLVILIPLTVPLIQNIGVSIIQAKNKQLFRTMVLFVIAILNVIISIPLAKIYEGLGCAIASGICFFLGTGICMNYYYYKHMKIDIIKFWKNILKILIPVVISIILGSIIGYFIPLTGILGVLSKGIVYAFIYIPLVYKVGMNDYEKNEFSKLTKKILFLKK